MSVQTKVVLYGSLRPDRAREEEIDFIQEKSLRVEDLLAQMRVPAEGVQLMMVNHRAVPPDYVVNPGDRVALFPREYMIFADWKNYRS